MDRNHKYAAKVVVNSVTANYIKGQIPSIVKVLEQPFVFVPKQYVARKPKENYTSLVDEIEQKFATLASRNPN